MLTSNVFGSIKYLPFEDGLGLLFSNSTDNEKRTLAYLLHPILDIEYQFWPWIQEQDCEGCEPDVFIIITPKNKQKTVMFIEAKYLSDKSSEADEGEAPKDQLAREWDNLTSIAERERATPILLFVTADMGYPKETIEESNQEYKKKRKKEMTVFWISWRRLPTLFSATDHPILKDLVKVLQLQGLTFFEGIKKVEPIDIRWTFKAKVDWSWSFYANLPISWGYGNKNYNWNWKIEPYDWRFAG